MTKLAFDSSRRLACAGALATLAGGSLCGRRANAEAYPSRLVSIRVAFPAGGSADAGFRQVQGPLRNALGQTVIVENFPGAGGSIGAMNVLNSPADGYTLLGTTGPDLILAPLAVASARYAPSSFKLIGTIAVTDFVLVTSPNRNFRNLDALLAHAATPSNPEMTIGHWGRGSSPHIVGADFQGRTGARFLEVPYKGVAPIIPEIAGGQIDLSFLPLAGPTVGLIKSGKVRPIGVASRARNPYLPDVPTLNEAQTQTQALRDFDHLLWTGVFASSRTSDDVLGKLSRSLNESVRTPEFERFLQDTASRPAVAMDLAQANDFYKAEAEKIVQVAARIKLQPE